MKRSILNLGKILHTSVQKRIKGGIHFQYEGDEAACSRDNACTQDSDCPGSCKCSEDDLITGKVCY